MNDKKSSQNEKNPKRGRPRLSDAEKAKKAENKAKEDKRHLSWTFVVYPDSAPKNWREIIDDLHIKYAISPLHDRDINGDGSPKKPHWHVVLAFDTVKSYTQIKAITDQLTAPIPQAVNSLIGTTRYLAHLDNPEKAQYSVDDIVTGGNFPLTEILAKSATEKKAIVKEIYQYILDHDVTEYHEIVDYAFLNNDDWFEVLTNGYTLFFTAVIKSRRHNPQLQIARNIKIDEETGEVIE